MKSAMIGVALLMSACASGLPDPGYEPCIYMGRSNGCTTVPLASDELNRLAKQFKGPQAGKARLYIIRSTITGATRRAPILIDGRHLVTLAPLTYFMRDLDPGQYALSTRAGLDLVVQPAQFAADKIYFVQYDLAYVEGKWQGRFQVLAARAGPEQVRKAKLVDITSAKLH